MTFEDFMNEIENFSLREERFMDDFYYMFEADAESYNEQYKRMKDWLRAAFEAGKESKN